MTLDVAQTAPLRTLDRQLYGLQYLRALAALMVLASHAYQFKSFPLILLGTGVDLFFVISGFLMVAITDETSRPGPFLRARIWRIVPLYWLITTVSFVLLWGGIGPQSPIPFRYIANYVQDIPVSLIAASYAFVPWWNPGAGAIRPLVPAGWTLNLEMLFYALFAMALLLARRLQFRFVAAVIAMLALGGLVLPLTFPPLVAWTDPVILEFLIGAWIGTAWQARQNLWRALGAVALSCLVFATILAFFAVHDLQNLRFAMAGPVYAALLILVLQAEDQRGAARYRTIPLLLGNASYAIYLVQFPVMWVLERMQIARGPVFAIAMIALTLLAAALLYRWFELPLMRARRQGAVGGAADPR